MTSSKIRRAPARLLISRRPSRKPGFGGTSPMFRATARPAREEPLDRVEIVVWCYERVRHCSRRDSRRIRQPQRRDTGPCGSKQRVRMPVIASVELEHRTTSGGGSRKTYCAHDRLRTRAHEPEHLYRWKDADDPLHQAQLELGGS